MFFWDLYLTKFFPNLIEAVVPLGLNTLMIQWVEAGELQYPSWLEHCISSLYPQAPLDPLPSLKGQGLVRNRCWRSVVLSKESIFQALENIIWASRPPQNHAPLLNFDADHTVKLLPFVATEDADTRDQLTRGTQEQIACKYHRDEGLNTGY